MCRLLFSYVACGKCLIAKGRPQHIPSQTDAVVRFVQEHVAVFLRLCNLANKGRHKGCYA